VRPLLAIVFGGPSPEHDISILTGLLCERVLREAGHDVLPLYWTRTGDWVQCPPRSEAKDFLEGAPSGGTPVELVLGRGVRTVKKGLGSGKPVAVDAALNCCHGGAGENGGLNAVFDQLGIPLTGGPAPLAALGMDKLAFGAVLQAHGIPTLPRFAVGSDVPFAGPYIVKPRYGGSSIGIEVVEDLATAQALAKSSVHLRQGAVIEQFSAKAVDLNMGYRTHPEVEVSLLEKPLAPTAGEGIYSYGQKYLQAEGLVAAPRELPAKVPAKVLKEAERLTRAVLAATGIRGVGRLDFLLIGTTLHVNEINTIPGSMGMYLWPSTTDAAKMLLACVEEAQQVFRLATPAPFEPGAALRAAGGMAGKLGQIGSAG
jgi:D-alanine-D-alanine ligase